MMQMNHPNLIRLCKTYSDEHMLYFLLEPSLGGELYRILKAQTAPLHGQPEFYAACVVAAFDYLHNKNFIFRDLKPENLLVDAEGYVKLTDFGFCKEVKHKTWTMCGTPEYMAPEVIKNKGHGKGVDWWCLGILIYEIIVTHSPFFGKGSIMDLYQRIIMGEYRIPSKVDPAAVNIISGLLQGKPHQRLGVVQGGASKIKSHAFFDSIDWTALHNRKLTPPHIPDKKKVESLANFGNKLEPRVVHPYVNDGTNWDKDF
jgi:serine/threonine protein kinase